MQLGHRQSVDFDFFSEKANQSNKIVSWLEKARGLIVRDMNAHTVHVEIDEVKVSFIGGYRSPRVKELIWVDEIRLADTLDIGLMKFLAMTHRATVRDYIDIAAIFEKTNSLAELMLFSKQKYGDRFNPMIFLRGLVSFDDLDMEMPRMLDKHLKRTWRSILKAAVKGYV